MEAARASRLAENGPNGPEDWALRPLRHVLDAATIDVANSRSGGPLKKRLIVAALTSALALAGGTAAPAAHAHFSPVAVAKRCSAGYRHAVIAGAEKCLHAGQFCAHRYDRQYRRYGFRCIRYYPNVHRYRLTHA